MKNVPICCGYCEVADNNACDEDTKIDCEFLAKETARNKKEREEYDRECYYDNMWRERALSKAWEVEE
jgi:hypothetical protein